jgi:hypothetical protein
MPTRTDRLGDLALWLAVGDVPATQSAQSISRNKILGGDKATLGCLTSWMAATRDEAFPIRVVVIGELLALLDRPRGADPDDSILDLDIAVRPAGMVDVAGDVASDAGVDHRTVRHLEAPDVAAFHVPALPQQTLLVGDLLARVVNDPRVLGDGGGGIHPPTVNSRSPFFNHQTITLASLL